MANTILKSVFLALAFIVMSGLSGTANAGDILSFSDMQIRATVPGMKTSAAYLEIINNGALDDRLIRHKRRLHSVLKSTRWRWMVRSCGCGLLMVGW